MAKFRPSTINAMMDTYNKFGLSEGQLKQLRAVLESGRVGVAQTNDLVTDLGRNELAMGARGPGSAATKQNLLDFIQRNSQATTTPTPSKPGKITAQQFFEGKKANVPTTPATPNVVTRPVQPKLPAYGPMQQSSYPKIEITPATQSTSTHNARIRGVQLDQPQPMQGPRPATQLGPQRAPIQGPRMSTPPISTAAKTTGFGSRFAGALKPLGKIFGPLVRMTGLPTLLDENASTRQRAEAGLTMAFPYAGMAYSALKGAAEAGDYGGMSAIAGQDILTPLPKDYDGKSVVKTDNPRFADIRGSITPGSDQPAANNLGEGAAFDAAERFRAGAGYPAGSPRPADYPLQSNAPTSPITPPVDPRGPSAADLLDKFNDNEDAAEAEGMRIWAQKFGKLAAKVKPGQAGYEVIQEVLNTDNTGAAISPFAQAFADQKIGEMFTDNRFADTFTNSINLQNPLQGFELDAAAPYSNADLGDVDFLTASQMPSLLTAPGQSFKIPQAIINAAKAMPFDRDDPTKEYEPYATLRDRQIMNDLATRTTEPVFDEATQSWKQVPISR